MNVQLEARTGVRPALPAVSNSPLRLVAQQTLSRVAGAPLIAGNRVDLLIDARANFDAWLAAIRGAQQTILLENYMFADDELSREIRSALVERAVAGVRVYVVRDWLGCLGQSRESFWKPLTAVGGEVRTYNSLRLISPLGWLSRNHRKSLVVDASVGFVSGVCVSGRWLGDPARGIPAWRDTGVAIVGPALRELACAFSETWSQLGAPLPADVPALQGLPGVAGDVALRVVTTMPRTTGLYRLDQLIAAIAQRTLWLTDSYFVGTPAYVQALCAAASDGVDVRLLVPGTSDLPLVGAVSRAGYRPLLDAGVRVFEWNGSMLHAKTATADGRWARVGSTNLNIASWASNCEIDVAIENEEFTQRMDRQYEQDLAGSTEIVLSARRPWRPRQALQPRASGSGRAAIGAARLANTVGAAIGARRVVGASERRILLAAAVALLGAGLVALWWPRLIAGLLAALAFWGAFILFVRYAAAARKAASRPSAAHE